MPRYAVVKLYPSKGPSMGWPNKREGRACYDTRGPHSSMAKHWQDTSLEGRAFFRTMMEPSTLSIDNISEKDGGEYHCRIDYYRSPTKNNRVTLNIVVPPQNPTIIDERGKEVPSVAGPYEEGGDLQLTCIVSGGK
nr:unnamed protein product [Callosobruchus analis]